MCIILFDITVGLGCKWGQRYKVVPLASLLSEDRASQLPIRTVVHVIFTEVVFFPLQQRIMLHGTYENTTLLAPMTTDETEKWAVIKEGGAEHLLKYEGACNANAQKFRKMKAVEVMMAIDPGT